MALLLLVPLSSDVSPDVRLVTALSNPPLLYDVRQPSASSALSGLLEISG